MPKLYVYGTDRQKTTRITISFARGAIRYNNETNGAWQVKHLPISNFLEVGFPSDLEPGKDAVATLGILRGTGLMLKSAKRKGIDYYYIDHAYFMPGYGGKGWMRISKNSHTCTTLRDIAKDKWNGFHKNYGYQNEKWKTNAERGRDILVLPPTNAVSWFFDMGADEWLDNTIKKLKSLLPPTEHYRIKVRHKPKEPIVDKQGNLIELKTHPGSHSDVPFETQLLDAQVVVAYNSMAALQATMKGIPVITSENSCCNKVSFSLDVYKDQHDPEEFNTEPLNRSHLLFWLAANQWKMRDIESGNAWKCLQENYS